MYPSDRDIVPIVPPYKGGNRGNRSLHLSFPVKGNRWEQREQIDFLPLIGQFLGREQTGTEGGNRGLSSVPWIIEKAKVVGTDRNRHEGQKTDQRSALEECPILVHIPLERLLYNQVLLPRENEGVSTLRRPQKLSRISIQSNAI